MSRERLGAVAEDIAEQAREMLAGELAELGAKGEALREVAVRAIALGAQIGTLKLAGEDVAVAEEALASAVQSLRAAGMVELAAKIRRTLLGLFGILLRSALVVLL